MPQRPNDRIKNFKAKRESVREFFAVLPKMPSHYCRSSTGREYLEPIWQSKVQLFREFQDWCIKSDKPTVKRTTFEHEMTGLNVALFLPRKDQCDTCIGYEEGNVLEVEYNFHIQKKNDARDAKIYDKEHGKHVYTVDMEAVLLCPVLKASALYYKTKLCVHNFTIYNLKTHDVDLYVWDETQADLTANVFASCMYTFITTKVPFEAGDEIIIYSDGCNYQNRNVILSNMYVHLAQKFGITIIQKILEKGHTQMEGDSVHSSIETRKKNQPIFLPSNYIHIMETARLENSYTVHYLDHTFF